MRRALPIDEVLDDVIAAIRRHRRVVIQAPPGAGKSTRVPAALLDANVTDKDIVLLEPRRVAARSIARRIAFERDSEVGKEVGWRIRWDSVGTKDTRLWVVTEGIIAQRVTRDPFLEDIGLLILDEFHERSIHTDLAVAFAAQLLELRDDLAVVVMSATLDAERVADFLDAPVVTSLGRSFDVETSWLPAPPSDLASATRDALVEVLRDPEDDGDVLVFLPGVREIDACFAACAGLDIERHRLHSRQSDAAQDAALSAHGPRKVVFATNIAETSLTLPRVTVVIDSGLVRHARADVGSGFDRLETTAASLASATQRAGRAGRVRPGRAVRLWTRDAEHRRPAFDVAAIRRLDLTPAALAVAQWTGGPPAAFAWFERPSEAQLAVATQTLEAIGALRGGTVTPLGEQLATIPAHPRVARLLVACAQQGALAVGARAAACLTEQDWVTAVDHPSPHHSDLWLRVQHLDDVAAGRTDGAEAARRDERKRQQVAGLRVDVTAAKRAARVAESFARLRLPSGAASDGTLDHALAAAFPDRIAFHASGRRYALASGGSVVLDHASVVQDAEIIVVLSTFGTTRVDGVECGICRIASALPLEALPAEHVSSTVEVRFDRTLERLVARRTDRYGEFVIREEPAPYREADTDDERDARVLAAAVAEDVEAAWALDRDAVRLLQRLEFARRWLPEFDVPDVRDPEFLLPLVWGKRSFAELRKESFARSVMRCLNGAQRDALERYVPDTIALPKRAFRVDYSEAERPVLAARIQDFFGVATTPTIAQGRVTLTLHLLAPNQRPQQVTQDLASFWRTTYADVRKELRARYPKHDWPDPAQW